MSTAQTTPPFPPSRVPRYRFGDTLEQQERELAANPMLARMRRSRQELAVDPHRPQYHFVSPESNLNDPNGLCNWRGNWHLFYQAYPPDHGNDRVHWGHAVSSDLIHWRDLPYAIHPGPERNCFSGSTLVEEERVLAAYYGTDLGIVVASAGDPLLLNWEKLAAPAIPNQPGQVTSGVGAESAAARYRVHDPCIWRAGGTYYALSNGRDPWRPMNFVFRSDDLQHWKYLHPFVAGHGHRLDGDDGACPYFWPIGSGDLCRHILLYFSHMSGGQYLLGDYDPAAVKFHATAHGKFNFGAFRPAGVHVAGRRRCGQPDQHRLLALLDTSRRLVTRAGDRAGLPGPRGAAEAARVRGSERGGGVRERPPVRRAASLSGAGRQHRGIAARAGPGHAPGLTRPVADGPDLPLRRALPQARP